MITWSKNILVVIDHLKTHKQALESERKIMIMNSLYIFVCIIKNKRQRIYSSFLERAFRKQHFCNISVFIMLLIVERRSDWRKGSTVPETKNNK